MNKLCHLKIKPHHEKTSSYVCTTKGQIVFPLDVLMLIVFKDSSKSVTVQASSS